MGDPKTELIAIVGASNILEDDEVLENYSTDHSLSKGVKPQSVVKVGNVDQVQKIIEWANQTGTPLVPVSSGPPHFHGDTVPGVYGAVIVDLSGMKKILQINRRNRLALIEPGVTYAELQPALAREGMRLSNPLLPRANKSVVTSLLEREPRLNSRLQWSSLDPLRCMELVFGDGNRLWTGDAGMGQLDLEKQWAEERWQLQSAGPGQTDFCRFLTAAQGSMGVATWASVRCEVMPQIHRFYFVSARKLDDLLDFTYRVLKYRYADELFIMNGTALAYAIGQDVEQISSRKDQLPPWMTLVGIAGREELPQERVDFQEKDISEISREFGLELVPDIPGISGEQVLEIILNPSREPYWKYDYKGNCQDIFFITTLNRVSRFLEVIKPIVEQFSYPVSDIGVYLQPRHQGVNCHCEFMLPYDNANTAEVFQMQELYTRASQDLADVGAFYTRPYGIWSEISFPKDPQSTALLRRIKNIFDPNGIMNPGKLCIDLQESKKG